MYFLYLYSYIILYMELMIIYCSYKGFSDGWAVKHAPANAGDMGSVPGVGRFPGEGNSNPLQYSYPGNPVDRGACGL